MLIMINFCYILLFYLCGCMCIYLHKNTVKNSLLEFQFFIVPLHRNSKTLLLEDAIGSHWVDTTGAKLVYLLPTRRRNRPKLIFSTEGSFSGLSLLWQWSSCFL